MSVTYNPRISPCRQNGIGIGIRGIDSGSTKGKKAHEQGEESEEGHHCVPGNLSTKRTQRDGRRVLLLVPVPTFTVRC